MKFNDVKNMSNIPELKNKIFFTLLMILVYRLGSYIPTPGVDPVALKQFFTNNSGGVLGFLDMFSGGALSRFSIFALGIAPYINASIIMQLLVYVFPYLEKLSKEGDIGRRKITQYTRYLTVVIGILQAFGFSVMLRGKGILLPLMDRQFAFFIIVSVLTLTAGTVFIMWLGEQITKRGIGNGISLLIFAGIMSRLPLAIMDTYRVYHEEATFIPRVLVILAIVAVVIAAIIYVLEGVRKIPVQYAKRVVGRRVYGGQATHMPLKVNQAGVIPIIFASSILLFPGMVLGMINKIVTPGGDAAQWIGKFQAFFRPDSAFYLFSFCLMIIFFTYFYTAITFNPRDYADNLKKYGGFIPGVRAGRPTADFIAKILERITLSGAVFLAAIAILPTILIIAFKLPFRFGGTGLLIVVGVALDLMKQIESHLVTRNYEGFIKKRGRR